MNFLIDFIEKWQDIIDALFVRLPDSMSSITNYLLAVVDFGEYDIFSFELRAITLIGMMLYTLYIIIMMISIIRLVFPSFNRLTNWQLESNKETASLNIRNTRKEKKKAINSCVKEPSINTQEEAANMRQANLHKREDIQLMKKKDTDAQPIKMRNNTIDNKEAIGDAIQEECVPFAISLKNLTPKEYKKAKKEQARALKKKKEKEDTPKTKSKLSQEKNKELDTVPKPIVNIDDELDYADIENAPTIVIGELEIEDTSMDKPNETDKNEQDVLIQKPENIKNQEESAKEESVVENQNTNSQKAKDDSSNKDNKEDKEDKYKDLDEDIMEFFKD